MNKQNLLDLLDNYNPDYIEEQLFKKEIMNFLNKSSIAFGKENKEGHITGSAWIINKDKTKALLTHHFKLDRWLQLGGHTEKDEMIISSAMREAEEESGLHNIRLLNDSIFDIDVHVIPKRNDEKEHVHYDIRFLIQADENDKISISNESKNLMWVDLNKIDEFTDSKSILRMVEKTQKFLSSK